MIRTAAPLITEWWHRPPKLLTAFLEEIRMMGGVLDIQCHVHKEKGIMTMMQNFTVGSLCFSEGRFLSPFQKVKFTLSKRGYQSLKVPTTSSSIWNCTPWLYITWVLNETLISAPGKVLQCQPNHRECMRVHCACTSAHQISKPSRARASSTGVVTTMHQRDPRPATSGTVFLPL